MIASRQLISICVPMFNEQDNIDPFYDRLLPIMEGLADRFDFEILFTDNHSEDATFERLATLSIKDKRVRVIRFSRNFGFQRSILANYLSARGDAAIQIDCDLQDPTEPISKFIDKWQQDYKVVYGIRGQRPKEHRLLFHARRVFYRLIDAISEDRLPHDVGDFRLVDRCILDQLRNLNDQQPYLRGLIAALGFRQVGIPYDRVAREHGSSKFNIWRLGALAIDGILHHSIAPLRFASAIGFFICALACVFAVYIVVSRAFFHASWPEGWTSMFVLVLFSIGLNALLLGIIGEYVGRIFKNVKMMPNVVVESVIDHQVDPERTEILGPPLSAHPVQRTNQGRLQAVGANETREHSR